MQGLIYTLAVPRDHVRELLDLVGPFETYGGREFWQTELHVAADKVDIAKQWVRANIYVCYDVKVVARS